MISCFQAGTNTDELQKQSKVKKLEIKEAEVKLENLTIARSEKLKTVGNFVHHTVPFSHNEVCVVVFLVSLLPLFLTCLTVFDVCLMFAIQ